MILLLLTSVVGAYGQRSAKALPVHSIHPGFYITTRGGHTGFFVDYQYYVDDQISFAVKPGATGLSRNSDSTSYFIYGGINYRFNALRKPLRRRPFNSQPYAGFYPFTFEYIEITPAESGDPDNRFGFVPSGLIGYTLIFFNRIDLDMHAGIGVSFRLSGKAGFVVEPSAFAGIGLGVRF